MNWSWEGWLRRTAGWLLFWLVWGGEYLSVSGAAERRDGGRTFYVDSETGRDADDGQSPEHAWRSLDRVNAAQLRPGDTVRFKSGGVWRGCLVPASGDEGAPVAYTSFGQGPKPLILGSVARNRPEDWVKVRDNIWGTLPTEYRLGERVLDLRNTKWNHDQVAIDVPQSSEAGRLLVSLGGLLPPGAVFDFEPQSSHAAKANVADPLTVDVGNVIFDGGAVCGWKKWSIEDLSKPYDYYYDGASRRVYLYLEASPPSRRRSIELAMARHVVNQSGAHHVLYDGLAVMYGAAHGFGGGNTHHLVIRNCDLGYIGGAHQHTRPDGVPVRYGNAIEFWGAAHDNLVEGCRIWEVYDAALTNQGRGPDSKQINITYRNNFIRNAEYSFEYWNNPETAVTKNIRFINNTCVNAGNGWAHAQRPDPNGSHLMLYTNTAATSGIEVKYNIFSGATDWGCRYSAGWRVLPEMDFNLWFSKTGVMAYWFGRKIAGFDEYRRTTGLDAHSRFADPEFVDAARGDWRLRPDSPARKLRPDGGPVGAEMLWR